MFEADGENNKIKWSIKVKATPNQMHHAHVKVGTWSVITEDSLTEAEAKDLACSTMADMLAEVEELINA